MSPNSKLPHDDTTINGVHYSDQMHITVRFFSSYYSTAEDKYERSAHINCGMWDPIEGTWKEYEKNAKKRGKDYPYHNLQQRGEVHYQMLEENPLPRTMRETELAEAEQGNPQGKGKGKA